MSRLWAVLCVCAWMAGCTRANEVPAAAAAGPTAPAEHLRVPSYLAYEHTLAVEANDDQVPAVFEAVQAACHAAAEDACVVLEARISSGEQVFASLRFRATAAVVRRLIEVLSAEGRVASRSTTAEDLSGPIADTGKQLAMLGDYRKQLEALRGRPANDLDALMKLSRELADVQGQIESLTAQQANLEKRVQTQLLSVTISSRQRMSAWAPVKDSAAGFGDILLEGIAGIILVVAYVLPWALALGAVYGVASLVRRRIRQRRRNPAETRG